MVTSALETVEPESPPGLAGLYAQAIAGAVIPGRPDALPERELVQHDVRVERERLSAYQKVCGFRVGDELPATYPHILAFPLSMALMGDRSFPFPLLGMVHVHNRIELRRTLGADERLSIRLRAERLRPHRRGRQFDLVTEVEAG